MQSNNKYEIVEVSAGTFQMSHGDTLLCSFTRLNFREVLEKTAADLSLSSHWIGSILRIFHQKYPVSYDGPKRSNFDRVVFALGPEGVACYLRAKGLNVVKRLPDGVTDFELISWIESEGYEVFGLVGNDLYESSRNLLKACA